MISRNSELSGISMYEMNNQYSAAAAVTTGLWSPSVDVEPSNLATRCSGRCVAEWGRGAERWRTRRSAVSCAAGRVATSVVSSAALAGDPMGDGST